MNINELRNIKRFYPLKKSLKKFNKPQGLMKDKKNTYVYISDKEILEKINSGSFKKHPIYPIIVKYNGKEVYDLRDNLKLEIKKNKQGSKICNILGIGKMMVSRITAESWYSQLIKNDENVHHIDENKNNNHIRNLAILNKEKHVELHKKKKRRLK